ncbi:MAG: beta-ketoacyl-[acyl-carrier-protein] synthase family protein [Gemmataceae bacterium]
MDRPMAVYITGVGACTPLGHSLAEVAGALLAGKSAIRRVDELTQESHPCRIGGPIGPVPCPPGEELHSFAQLSRLEQLVRFCCIQALRDAGLWELRHERRIGIVLGLGAEWMLPWEQTGLAAPDIRLWQPDCAEQGMVERTRRHLGLNGPIATVSAACASSNVALAQARSWLRLGWCDVVLAGGCDTGVSPLSLAAFGNLRALSRRNDSPQAASRPFDRSRDGFVVGEGGVVFTLERAADAARRTATVHAEVAGYGSTSDAYHMVIPNPEPGPASRAVLLALTDAGLNPDQVDYVNAHATSTPVGDTSEARVLATVLGNHLPHVPVSSTKSMTGHLLTAAAAIEALACIAAIQHHAVPPTINLDDPDPTCHLRHVPHEAQQHRVKVAVSNSFGFGGSNACLVLRAA